MLTEQEVMERLKGAVADAGGQRAFAEKHGLTPGYVNDVLHGKRAFADRILATIGIERQVTYHVTYNEKSSET